MIFARFACFAASLLGLAAPPAWAQSAPRDSGSIANPRAAPPILRVALDRARLARLPERAKTLVVGQPGVADVTLLKPGGLAVLTGKSYGETNLIALDSDGELLGEWTLRVGAKAPDLVVQNGVNRESFACAPSCLPMVDLGDAKAVNADRAAAASTHQAFSTGR